MRKYDVVLLDADMTIFDFERSERESLHRTLTAHGLAPTEEVESTYLKINHALWDAFARGEVDQDFLVVERFAALARVYQMNWDSTKVNRDYLNGLGEEAHLLPGAMEFCTALRDMGLTVAIATNGMPVAQRGRYTKTGMDRVIPHIFISMELGVQKPLPLYFDKVCQALNITDRSRVVMVGDSLNSDILGGNNAGIDTVWYNPKGAPLTGAARPTYTVSTYHEILNLLS